MNRITTRSLAGLAAGIALVASTFAGAAGAEPPRPGCGFGDDNHSHQAAPGQDPENLRPGDGAGDDNHEHTVPPGLAPEDGGVQGDPARGCGDDPTP